MNFIVNVLMWAVSAFVVGGAFFGWFIALMLWNQQHDNDHRGHGGFSV